MYICSRRSSVTIIADKRPPRHLTIDHLYQLLQCVLQQVENVQAVTVLIIMFYKSEHSFAAISVRALA